MSLGTISWHFKKLCHNQTSNVYTFIHTHTYRKQILIKRFTLWQSQRIISAALNFNSAMKATSLSLEDLNRQIQVKIAKTELSKFKVSVREKNDKCMFL